MELSLTERLQAFVRQRAAEAGYASPEQYIRDLIREDRQRLASENLQQDLIDALRKDGIATDSEAIRAQIEAELTAELGRFGDPTQD